MAPRSGRGPSWPRLHEWLLIGVGLALIIHYRWLLDDAFLYFRYVDNLLFLRVGLVFNAGEYVEGFASPLQCIALALLRWFELDWMHAVTSLGALSFAVFASLIVRLNRELSPAGPIFDLPLAYLACLYATTSFFTSGIETPLAQMMAPAFALLLLAPRGVTVTAMVAAAPLVLPELALAVALTGAFTWWRTRRFPELLLALTLAFNGAWLCFRIVTYADLLPNTFYLPSEVRGGQGLAYLWDAAVGTWLFVIPLALLAATLVARRGELTPQHPATQLPDQGEELRGGNSAARLAMVVVALVAIAYVVSFGNGALHYRELAFPLPLLVCATAGLIERTVRRVGARQATLGLASLGVALLAALAYPAQLSGHPIWRSERNAEVSGIADASSSRLDARLQPQSWRAAVKVDDLRDFAPVLAVRGYQWVVTGTNNRDHWTQYRTRVVHGGGLTDPVLARVESPRHRPGDGSALAPLVEDVARLRRRRTRLSGAIQRGMAPPWMVENRAAIEKIERKMYNRHRPRENLRLAFSFPGRLRLPQLDTSGRRLP